MDTEAIKNDFPIFKNNPGLVYLDSAASSQTPEPVLRAMDEYYRGYRSNIHRSMYALGERATMAYEKARENVADFIGAQNREVVFTAGSTMGMNMLIYSLEHHLDLKPGDEVVTTVTEHHSGLIPLQELAKRNGLVLKHIPLGSDFHLDYTQAEALITDKTKIVSLSLASNVLGTINDVNKVASYARRVGALVICDGTKAVGHIEVNVRKLDCDFLVFSGHKMCGPTGIGILYGKEAVLETLPPSIFGGGMVEEVSLANASFRDIPARFEAGTPNIVGAIGLGAAVDYLRGVGMERIAQHTQALTGYALAQLGGIDGVELFAQKDTQSNAGIVSFLIRGIHPHDIAEIAGRRNVALRAGHHCANPLMKELGVPALVRASFYIYNDKSDVDALVEVIAEAKRIFGTESAS